MSEHTGVEAQSSAQNWVLDSLSFKLGSGVGSGGTVDKFPPRAVWLPSCAERLNLLL